MLYSNGESSAVAGRHWPFLRTSSERKAISGKIFARYSGRKNGFGEIV
jgi:hypothetical protein